MTDRLNREILNEAVAGDRITLQQWNAVVRAIKANSGSWNGFQDEGSSVSSPKIKSSIPTFTGYNSTGETIPPFSILGIKSSGVEDDALQLVLEKIGAESVSSQLLLVTNGSIEIPNARYALVECLDFTSTHLITCTDVDSVPDIGMPCGIDPDTFEITKNRFGLVCVSLADEDNRVYVKRSSPITVVGCVTNDVLKYRKSDTTFGQGKFKIKYMDGVSVRHDAKNPYTGDDWEHDVYNPFDKVFPIGMQVTATDSLGIGFVINSATANALCGEEGEPLPNVGGNDGCCCDETNCLRIPGTNIEVLPQFYQFRLPLFNCGCAPANESNTVRLYPPEDAIIAPDDFPTIWTQDPKMRCLGPVSNSQPCSSTGTYEWQPKPCSGSSDYVCGGPFGFTTPVLGTYVYPGPPDPPPDYDGRSCTPPIEGAEAMVGWMNNVPCNSTCAGEDCVPDTDALDAYNDAHPEGCDGPQSFNCVIEDDPYHWVLISESDAECDCIPPEPDIDGEEPGQTVETDCDGSKLSPSEPCVTEATWTWNSSTNQWEGPTLADEDCNCTAPAPDIEGTENGQETTTECEVTEDNETLRDSYWRLTIVPDKDYFGCDGTTLDFIIE